MWGKRKKEAPRTPLSLLAWTKASQELCHSMRWLELFGKARTCLVGWMAWSSGCHWWRSRDESHRCETWRNLGCGTSCLDWKDWRKSGLGRREPGEWASWPPKEREKEQRVLLFNSVESNGISLSGEKRTNGLNIYFKVNVLDRLTNMVWVVQEWPSSHWRSWVWICVSVIPTWNGTPKELLESHKSSVYIGSWKRLDCDISKGMQQQWWQQ